MSAVQVVWFKRDLRVADHAPLAQAAARGPVLCLYVIEPELWQQPDAARQHYAFTLECLRALYRDLQALGLRLHVRVGVVTDVLQAIDAALGIAALHSHEETGNGWTYARDQAVARWCREHGVAWHECAQFGVLRGLRQRARWQQHWDAFMALPQVPDLSPEAVCDAAWSPPAVAAPSADDLGLSAHEPAQRQRGGRAMGLAVLQDFLDHRSAQYRGGISSPLKAPTACSRLSPYLAWGCVSLREVVQATGRARRVATCPRVRCKG